MRFFIAIIDLFLALNIQAQATIPKTISTIDLQTHVNETKGQTLEEFYTTQFETTSHKKGAIYQVTADGKALYFENSPVFLISTPKKDSAAAGVVERYVVAKRDTTVPYEKYKWKSVPMKELKLLLGTSN